MMLANIIPLMAFSFVASITPGPNNLLLAVSGVNFGFRRTMPHFMGVYFGFLIMLAIVCLGLGSVFTAYPGIQNTLRYFGTAYLLYLAYRIASSRSLEGGSRSKPFTFIEAAIFQYVNPKAWMIAGTIASAFLFNSGSAYVDAAIVVGLHGLVCLPAVMSWVMFGTMIGHYLKDPKHRKIFNYAMAGLLVVTSWMIVRG